MSDSVAVLFSGGSDSTLAAALGAQRFKRVYLVTYLHALMFFHKKIHINVGRLAKAYPDVEFITHEERFTGDFARVYFQRFFPRLLRYRSMVVTWLCASCKLAMHLRTIRFCREQGIGHVYCGAHEESSRIFPAQMQLIMAELQALYLRHGIIYESPVYYSSRTDQRLKDMGIIDDGRMKDQHLIYTTQHTCPIGVMLHAHSRLYYTKVHGLETYHRRAHEMTRDAIGPPGPGPGEAAR